MRVTRTDFDLILSIVVLFFPGLVIMLMGFLHGSIPESFGGLVMLVFGFMGIVQGIKKRIQGL